MVADPEVVVKAVALDPTLVAAAAVTVLSSLGGTIVLIINAMSASKDRREASKERQLLAERAMVSAAVQKSTLEKADTIIESTAKIHELTNSTNSNLQKALELMTAKNAALEAIIAQAALTKRETEVERILSDQRTVVASASTPPAITQILDKTNMKDAIAESPHLKEIEENTKETAKNTAKDN